MTMTMATLASWPRQAEAWLDARGKGAWIVLMVLCFATLWPVGLLLLGYMLMNGKFSCGRKSENRDSNRLLRRNGMTPSGNSAFDAYRMDMLARLEDEQRAFDAFLHRLRDAKDKAEFDAFMDERAAKARKDIPAEA